MLDREKLIKNADFDTQFFSNFPPKRAFERFVCLHLPSGKFPESRKVNIVESLRDQDFSRAANHRRYDINDHDCRPYRKSVEMKVAVQKLNPILAEAGAIIQK